MQPCRFGLVKTIPGQQDKQAVEYSGDEAFQAIWRGLSAREKV